MSNNFNTIHLLHSIREIPQSVLNSTEKYILVMILSCLNEDNRTWYTIKNLAKFCCMTARGIRPHLKSLDQKGFITINKPELYARYKSNEYQINIDQIMSYHLTKSGDKTSPDMGENISPNRTNRGKIFPLPGENISPVSGENISHKERNKRKKEESACARASFEAAPPAPKGYEDLSLEVLEELRRIEREEAELRARGITPIPAWKNRGRSVKPH